jgi:membrane fusion protein (multidrug efflux system)
VQELQGLQSLFVIGPENKVQARTIVTGDRVGDRWLVVKGLQAGERVVVEGIQKAIPGSVVNPKPYEPAAAESQKGL